MKGILLVCLLFATVYGFTEREYQNAFTQWMQKYHKSYHHDEFHVRYATFKKNMDFVFKHNSEKHTFVVGLNKFADLTNQQFARLYTGLKMPDDLTGWTNTNRVPKVPNVPASWDWNTQGAVTPIKDQGQCGSCWSFSTTGSTEGCHFISTQTLNSLSEQNLMDCSTNWGNEACEGGLMTEAMNYIIANGGIDTEASYPYTAQDGSGCNYAASNSGATLKNMYNVTSADENDLQSSTYTGPTSVAIDASQSSFQMYTSGVYSDPDCSSTQLDHGVLATGWGTDDSGNAYWIVKNSWGTDWGMNGWIWMARNDNNMCGIATMATRPIC